MALSKLESILTRVNKPAQYLGDEVHVIKKDFQQAKVRVALIFPDKYELGMSHTGLKILYQILNEIPDVVCERAFAPDLDLEKLLRQEDEPLFSWESRRPLKDFDLLGFSATYELTYTNILNILDLAKIPVWQKDRTNEHPLIIGGGGCMMNAEPLAEFLDAAALGDGEELIVDVVNKLRVLGRTDREKSLDALSRIEGIYIPSYYEVTYHDDGTIFEIKPLKAHVGRIPKRIVANLDRAPYPTALLIPNVKLVHDRVGIEIQRGCNRACRFCQAGYIDRPVRQRSPETVLAIAEESLKQTGMEEISLLSLSAADYDCLVPLLKELNRRYAASKIAISVPATRTDKLSPELIEEIKKVRKTGFTVAPEAGSERMRRVINKGNKVDDLFRAVESAFSAGWDLLKLYYMVGLPFERDEDLDGIANEGNASIKICQKHSQRAELKLSLSSFVPKPFTPFQWSAQMGVAETKRRYQKVRVGLKSRRIRLNHHHPEMSYVEGLLSRGDRRVAQVLYLAFKAGCRFDEWKEHFDYSKWQAVFEQWELDPSFYVERERGPDEILPWDHLFAQMDKRFLWDELVKAAEAGGTPLAQVPSEQVMFKWKSQAPRSSWRRLKDRPLKDTPHHHEGFTEDCSLDRCSNCGVCDYKEIKNYVYRQGEEPLLVKKGHREWYGWTAEAVVPVVSEVIIPPYPPLKKGGKEGEASPVHYRLRFQKIGPARFTGHLDLMTTFRRAIKRAAFPMAYSQGFHPQMKLSMSAALPIGVESTWEYFDMVFTRDLPMETIQAALNAQLPQGLAILSVEMIDSTKPSHYSGLAGISYRVSTSVDQQWFVRVPEAINNYNQLEEFIWYRQRDRKEQKINLKEKVLFDLDSYPSAFLMTTKISPTGSVKPQDALQAVFGLSNDELSKVALEKASLSFN